MRSLTFWVRGASGGEQFNLDLRKSGPAEPSRRPNINEFLVGGISTSWKKVNIPIKAIFTDPSQNFLTENYEAISNINGIVLNFPTSIPTGTLYIDDVIFHSKSGNVMMDNFDDGADPAAFGYNPGDFVSGGAGASFTRSYDSSNGFGGSANAYKIVWSTGTSLPSIGVVLIEMDTRSFTSSGIGVDISGCDTLSFQLKGESNASGKLLGIGLGDDSGTEKIHPSTITITTSYQEITRPLSDFAVSKDSASEFELWTLNDSAGRGPPINSTAGMTFYVDNLRFLDTSIPTVPSAFLKNGASFSSGAMFTSTDTLSVTADAGSVDNTIERVRFEHDNLTGGASWFVLGADTDTADSTYSAPWQNFNSLIPGTSYQIRAVAEDVAGNEGSMSAITNVILPLVHSATGFSGAVVSLTSLQWNWYDNSSNEGGFRVFSSTGGRVSPDLTPNTTFWLETGLSPNGAYGRFVRPFKGGALYTASSPVSKYTLANPVASLSTAAVTDTSVTLSWSTGTGGGAQFVIQRASDVSNSPGAFVAVATVTGNTFVYEDSGLDLDTTYWYRVIGFSGDLIATAPSAQIKTTTGGGPQISHVPVTSIGVLGSSVTIQATAVFRRPLQSFTLFYRKKGQISFTSSTDSNLLLVSSSPLKYSVKFYIPASFVQDSLSVSGFEYFIVAADVLQISTSPSSGVYSVLVSQFVTSPPIGPGGGSISMSDGDPMNGMTSLTIPPGALSGNVQISVTQLNVQNVTPLNNLAPVAAYEFGPSGLQFMKPVTMRLLYLDKDQDGLVDGTSVRETDLKFFWFDGFAWRNLGGTVDPQANTVTATVSHFSTFALFPASDPAESDVRPKEKIITPNNDGINDFAQFGISGTFIIDIFDVRGHRIRRLENVNVWDGRKDDGDAAESGVYVYQVKSSLFKVSGTIGVAR